MPRDFDCYCRSSTPFRLRVGPTKALSLSWRERLPHLPTALSSNQHSVLHGVVGLTGTCLTCTRMPTGTPGMIAQLSPLPQEHYYQLTSFIKSFLTIFSLAASREQSRQGGVWVIIPKGTSWRLVIVLWGIRTSTTPDFSRRQGDFPPGGSSNFLPELT